MRLSAILATGVAAALLTWMAAPELAAPARALTAFLIGLLPAFSVLQAVAAAQRETLPSRLTLYGSTMITLWGLAFVTAFVATESAIDPRLLGVMEIGWLPFLLWTIFATAATGALVLAFKSFGMTETPLLQHLIPQTWVEKLVYVGVCLTAGICEELVFRGFLIAALNAATGSLPLAVVLSAGAFGVAHAHQDAAGAMRATLLALVLSVPLLVTGSLYPGIAAHAIVDLLGGLWLSKWLLRSE